MEDRFKLKEHNTNVKTEVVAGITTFLSMCYILAINPRLLAVSGMDDGGIFTATAISAAVATLCMAFFANYPIVLASGMGLNAYFSFSVCLPLAKQGVDSPWQIALTAILVEGLLFVILTATKFRETLVNKIPANLKRGITAGIGLFIALVGAEGAKLAANEDTTLVTMGDVATPQVALAVIGLLAIAIMSHYKVTGAILWGILLTWGLGMIAQVTGWYQVDIEEKAFSLFPDFSQGLHLSMPTFFDFNLSWIGSNILEFITIVFAFFFVDLFDTAGTLVGVASKAGLLDKDGNLPRAGAALLCDAIGTIVGACMGTSTVTSYVESSAGVAVGGRTGLTALTAGILFLVALPLSPVFLAIPGFATAPALMYVGFLMLSAVKDMDFSEDMAAAIGGYLAIIMMPFTYSIANGIMFGMLAFVIIKVFQGQAAKVHPIMWVAAALFAMRIYTLI